MSPAKAGADKSAAETSEQYLTFMLAGEEYGVDILRVQEIKGWDKVTRIPNTPDFVLGVINLRGAVVPIIDLPTCGAGLVSRPLISDRPRSSSSCES
jgi:chemotaxis signal transduction protein